jgi:hypothetical protein
MAVKMNELPNELKQKLNKRLGLQRENIIRVAASVVKACAESGESLIVQRKALELALKWLKIR